MFLRDNKVKGEDKTARAEIMILHYEFISSISGSFGRKDDRFCEKNNMIRGPASVRRATTTAAIKL